MNLLHEDYLYIRYLIEDVLTDLPQLCCEDFHHDKKDQHKDNNCPVEKRFYFHLNKLKREFNLDYE